MQFKPVQTYIAKKAANYLSSELHTRIEIKSLFIKPFKSLVLEELYIEDLQKDTLLFAPKFTIDLNSLSIKNRRISVNIVQLDSGKFHLKELKDTTTNLDFIINYFNTGEPKPKTKPVKKPYDITFDNLVLNDFTFKYKNYRVDTVIEGINYDDVLLTNLNANLIDLDTKSHLFKAGVKHLSFKEKSGFQLKSLKAEAVVDTNKMEFKDLEIITPNTRLTNYVLLSYEKFRDFNSFISKVKIDAHLNNTHIHPRDIAFFAPVVRKLKLPIAITGNLSGYVNNIKARNVSIKAGQATYLKGNFNIQGLPKLNETFLDLNFEQIASNKKDADQLIYGFTGLKGQIPAEVQKFGNINFKGKFTGFIKDFIAYGEFKTRLGRFTSDVNMKILNIPVYSGTIKTYDFNIGELVNEETLGRTTATLVLNGQGFNRSSINEKLSGSITYLDFKGYRYRNIKLDGTFNKNLFAGKIKVDDQNLNLDFNGNIDINPNLPQFKFEATVKNANLNKLNLSKDTIQIDASFSTNFTGNNLDNIQGDLALRSITLTTPTNSLVVDSVSLFARGIGNDRQLAVRSDILDASIKGQYDLNTLPSYFKTVVKRYIPSLNTTIVKPQPQDFAFDLVLKQFDPITLLYIPDLQIPEGASINGRFVSSKNIATLNIFSKLIVYKGVKANNLILDEAAGEKALNVFITSDRIDITDSIYIKNVNIANILRNDSLSLNIKLSDKDATNQLDLNSLIKFNSDSAALFSILPSDLIINNESWRVQEQVKIGFEKTRTTITDFALSRGNQVVTVDGAISSNPDDKLNLNFKEFMLRTFNPLTKGAGIALKGVLNGDVSIASISKNTSVESSLIIDSLNMNDTEIGQMDLKAGFDNETKLINVATSILRRGKETLNVTGTYNASQTGNSLDMTVKMEESPLIIFQPFIKKLVTDLTGTVSANLQLSGTVFNPRIDGTLGLNNAGFVVNYLKTPYRITNNVIVENSVIKLENLVIKDNKNHQAIANGTVDMNNPNNPDINAVIEAKNFMALNTTAKDNPLYYGVAYGTGEFSFKGPTDNMHININAKTEAGTVFNIPLNSSETISDNEFITFVAKDSSETTAKKVNVFEGLVLNFDLEVDRNSTVNIITDMGRLSGRGETESLNLKITSLGDFEMYGTYNISEGKFEFTAQDYINKVFQISQGGTIRWTGDPTEATIDLKAIYEVRTSLRPLYIAAGRPPTDQRVLAQAVMNLSKNLLQPEISFDLNFPTDAYVKDELQAFFSDVNNKNQQALSLIVRRSFSPNTGLNLGTVNSTVASAGTELVFNQLNNFIAESLNLPSVDLNIRSFNEASASVRLLDERLHFTYGITDRRTELYDYNFFGGNSIARDVEAQFLLKRDGSLMLRASNRLNNRSFLDPLSSNEYVSAIGLVYRQEFDNLNELLRILIGQKRKEERRNKLKTPPQPETTAMKPEETELPKKQNP